MNAKSNPYLALEAADVLFCEGRRWRKRLAECRRHDVFVFLIVGGINVSEKRSTNMVAVCCWNFIQIEFASRQWKETVSQGVCNPELLPWAQEREGSGSDTTSLLHSIVDYVTRIGWADIYIRVSDLLLTLFHLAVF